MPPLPDPHTKWAGWLYATDADTGEWKWRLKSNYPILSGVTPTAGGIVLFGDMGGNVYAVDAVEGKPLWTVKVAGAVGGGVITYLADGSQRIALAAGLSSILWPTEQATAKIVIFGLPESESKH
jgi:alcohol dehydrogenase (cytochrome c)